MGRAGIARCDQRLVGGLQPCGEDSRVAGHFLCRRRHILECTIGDITSELRALEWVTSPQRASSMAATDFTASGWSGGVLTSFISRGGQVREWIQSSCPRTEAAAHLAGTPPDWAGFAQRNAELAAALAGHDTGSWRGND